jgi:hypothetical protein
MGAKDVEIGLPEGSTQRNLDAAGRVHAKRVGAWFSRERIVPTAVRNSSGVFELQRIRARSARRSGLGTIANYSDSRHFLNGSSLKGVGILPMFHAAGPTPI